MSTASKDAAGWQAAYTIAGAGEKTITFKTENKFVDADARVTITTPAASAPTLSVDDNTTTLPMGTASSGKYTVSKAITGKVNVSTAGWITSGDHTVSDSNVTLGVVNESTLKVGTTTISSGATITPSDSAQTITISEGYNSARTLTISAADSGTAGEITSGSATIDTVTYLYSSTDDNFTISGSADVSAPTVVTAGYISSTKGTKNIKTNGAVLNASVDKITLGVDINGTTNYKPTLSKGTISINGVIDASSGNATDTVPSSGVYVAVYSQSTSGSISANAAVKTPGYGDVTNFGRGGAFDQINIQRSNTYYIPITTTSASVNGRDVTYGTGWITGGTSQIALGAVTSGAGIATISSPTWDNTNSKFAQTASGTIAAPIINTAGYLSSTEGTKNSNSISGSNDLDIVKVGVTISGTAKVTPAISRTAKPSGDTWIDAANGAVTTTKPTSGAYVRVDAAAKSNNLTISGIVSEEGYGTSDHYLQDDATITAVGSNAAAATYVPIKAGAITSGTATISAATYTYNSTNDNFDVTGSANVSAPTFTEGYIASDVGTKNANTNGASLDATVSKIAIQANLSGTGTKKPSITKNANTNIPQAGTATTTKPSSGYYVAVSSAANTGTVQATATVVETGYGTTTSGQYTTTPSSSLTVGAAASSVTYVPITQATFANTATSGTTYADISSSAPILISGDYLYINAGYTPDSKISLAKLVPDATAENAPANYILAGYTAFTNDGTLITGTMQTYDGTYTVT